jgi:hypothetical protein
MRLCVYSLGVRSTRFIGPACAEPPGGTRRWNVEAPRRNGGCISIESASRSPLGERSARAFRLAIPWHEPATCAAAAMPRSHPRHAEADERFHTLSGFVISPSAHPRTGAHRSGWSPRVPFPLWNRGSLGFPRRLFFRGRGGPSRTASVFLHHPRAPPCFTARPSRSPLRPRPGTKRAR